MHILADDDPRVRSPTLISADLMSESIKERYIIINFERLFLRTIQKITEVKRPTLLRNFIEPLCTPIKCPLSSRSQFA